MLGTCASLPLCRGAAWLGYSIQLSPENRSLVPISPNAELWTICCTQQKQKTNQFFLCSFFHRGRISKNVVCQRYRHTTATVATVEKKMKTLKIHNIFGCSGRNMGFYCRNDFSSNHFFFQLYTLSSLNIDKYVIHLLNSVSSEGNRISNGLFIKKPL